MKNAFFTLIVLITTALPVLADPAPISGPWGVYASGFKNLSTALASPDTVGKTVVVSKLMDTNSVTTDRTISVTAGGRINVAKGQIFTINGPFDAGLYQVFSGLGRVSGLKESRPEWFGMNIIPGTTDMAPVCQKAADSLTSNGTLLLSANIYSLRTFTPYVISHTLGGNNSKTCIKLTGNKSIRGVEGSVLKVDVDDDFPSAITLTGNYETVPNSTSINDGPYGSRLSGFKMIGTDTASLLTEQYGGGIRIFQGRDVQVFNCSFENLRGIPINIIEVGGRYGVSYYSEGMKAHHNYIKNCHGDGIYFRFCMYSDITDNVILDTGFTDGIIFEAVKYGNISNNHIYHPTAVSGPARGILINGGSDDCIISGNTVKVNTLNNAIFLVDSFRAQVSGNNLSRDGDASGFALITSHTTQGLRDAYNNIHDNTLLNGSPGIRISNNHNRISGNVISGGTEGIIVDGGNYNIISNNDIVADGYGIKLRGYDGRQHPVGTVVLNNRTDRIDDEGINSTKRGNIFSIGPVSGKAMLSAGTITVNTAEVMPADIIMLTRTIAGGAVGHLSVGTIISGTSFVINSSSSTDSSTIFWEIRH